MIKLVACDIDGTLLQRGDTGIHPEIFSLIKRLREREIAFCTASGRQYSCQRRMFAPVAGDIYYICENGAVIFDNLGNVISKSPIPRQDAWEMVRQILDIPRCEALISGERTCYILPKKPDFLLHMRDVVGNDTTVISSLEEIDEEVIKVAAYCRDGSAGLLQVFQDRWGENYSVAIGGELWVDLTLASKAAGIRAVCKAMCISPQEVMAFGDNFNDLDMLRMVGVSCAMAHSHRQVQAAAGIVCARVEPQLEKLLG